MRRKKVWEKEKRNNRGSVGKDFKKGKINGARERKKRKKKDKWEQKRKKPQENRGNMKEREK